ncbi:MAG: CBS domain-containing protein [Rhodospirillales bacterium]
MRRIVPDVIGSQRLLKLPPTATVREAAKKMAARAVRSVLVCQRGRLQGIFTGTDLIKVVADGRDLDATPLSAVMTAAPQTVASDEPAVEALRRMHAGRFRHLPVVDAGKLVGILSRRDFIGIEVDEIEREERVWERI